MQQSAKPEKGALGRTESSATEPLLDRSESASAQQVPSHGRLQQPDELSPPAAQNSLRQLDGADRTSQPTKLELIHDLLARPDGAALEELVSATGWQSHSVRAGMTALRKKGLVITRLKGDGASRFAIATQPTEDNA
jgi:hypothetical protein